MKYLLQAIEARRESVRLSDPELRKLLVEVRNGRDDRIEFIESMTRLLDEIRSSEHASAFLNKVSKRDAPDYYDVIKNPMDLGTMLRNVKNGRYKSKAQFTRDLDLIWDNCLTYNSEPTHPLRRNVQMLRSKANHLLAYVNDTNDVREALSQWEASAGLSSGEEARAVNGSTSMGIPWADGLVPESDGARRKRDGLLMNGEGESVGIRSGLGLKRARAMIDAPFEQRPALIRNTDAMKTFSSIDDALARQDHRFSKTYLQGEEPSTSDQWSSNGAGPSSKPMVTFSGEPGEVMAEHTAADFLKTLDAGANGDLLKMALTMGREDMQDDMQPTKGRNSPNGKPRAQRFLYPLDEAQEPNNADMPSVGAWWSSLSHPSLLPSGIASLPTSERLPPSVSRVIGNVGSKRRHGRTLESRSKGDVGKGEAFGGVDALERNVGTIQKLRRTHAKFGALSSHLEHEEPIPAWLAVASSDEEEEEQTAKPKSNAFSAYTVSELARRKQDESPPPLPPGRNPFATISSEGAREVLFNKVQFLLSHAGFEGAQKSAAEVMADVSAEYIMSLGRTLRMYTDYSAHEMSVEEIILHSLYENGGADVRSLESYIVDDVERYGTRLSELLRKLRMSYRDQLNAQTLTMEDEDAFFGDAGGGDEANEAMVAGNFAEDLGDDFFGFKAMGLDAELGVSGLNVPMKLFRARNNRASGGLGVTGRIGKGTAARKYGPGGMVGSDEDELPYKPPPPFIVLSEAGFSAQIGLLQPWYRESIRGRGKWEQVGVDVEQQQASEKSIAGEEGEPSQKEEKATSTGQEVLVLPDEEMERQRYKVPPNGRLPRREMLKDRLKSQEEHKRQRREQQQQQQQLQRSKQSHNSHQPEEGKKSKSGGSSKRKKSGKAV